MIESEPSRSVRELASAIGLSARHLQRLFKQETGVDVRKWLAEQRLQRAAYLLAASEMQAKGIAYLVGYRHYPSFVRAFERRFAQAPKQYRHRNAHPEC